MKIKNLFLSGLVCCSLVACSNNDEPNGEQKENGNKVAYLQVNIANSDATSRSTTDGGFEFGTTTDEHKITNADFYFYSSNGSFFTKKTLTNLTGTASTGETATNVEYLANPVLVLENVAEGNTPTWMIVVINAANDMDLSNETMEKALDVISSADIATKNNFVMTSSTFVDNTLGNNVAVDVSNSFVEEEGNSGDYANLSDEKKAILQQEAVDVFVERLAVKTRLNTTSVNSNNVIELTNAPALSTDNSSANKTKVYAKILGWGLNGTQKESYVLKNIDATWNFTQWNVTSWNDANNHRSYWAKSPNYASATATYPTDFDTATKGSKTEGETTTTNVDATNYALNYISWNEADTEVNTPLYCRENTNDFSQNGFGSNLLPKATSVLIKAQLSDASGNALSYYKWSGILYTTEADIKNALLTTAGFDLYYDATSTESVTERKGITANDVEFVNAYDGKVHLALTTEAKNKTWYKGAGSTTSINATSTDQSSESVSSIIENWFEELDAVNPCEFYNQGRMYYNVPIEHFGNTESAEGYYGVVRNHIYDITIKSVTNIGKAVYEPKEDIIPTEKDLKLYYLSAEINVLSWKVVKQEVEL